MSCFFVSRLLGFLLAVSLCGAAFAGAPNLSRLKPFVASPPYMVEVNGKSILVDIGGVARRHIFAGVSSLINPQTGYPDIATILTGDPKELKGGNGVYSDAEIPLAGVLDRVFTVNGKTTLAYRAGDLPVAGKSRTQISSFATPGRKKVFWDLEFVLGDAETGTGWPVFPVATHPVGVWQLKAPDVNPSLAVSVDTNSLKAGTVSLVFGQKGGQTENVVRVAQVDGLQRFKPIKLVMEAFLDERELRQGGQGYWRAWVNGNLVVDSYGPTLSAFATAPHQWFLTVYLYNDPLPLPDSWVTQWSQAKMLVEEE